MKMLDYVVIIDDDELSGVINELLLRKFNVAKKIKVFDDPKDAIEYLTEYSTTEGFPQLVLIDSSMPMATMNSFDAIRCIRELNAEIFFCVCSASEVRIDDAIMRKENVPYQLKKPLERKEFMDMIKLIVPEKDGN